MDVEVKTPCSLEAACDAGVLDHSVVGVGVSVFLFLLAGADLDERIALRLSHAAHQQMVMQDHPHW
jgi:hypothetical protein